MVDHRRDKIMEQKKIQNPLTLNPNSYSHILERALRESTRSLHTAYLRWSALLAHHERSRSQLYLIQYSPSAPKSFRFVSCALWTPRRRWTRKKNPSTDPARGLNFFFGIICPQANYSSKLCGGECGVKWSCYTCFSSLRKFSNIILKTCLKQYCLTNISWDVPPN